VLTKELEENGVEVEEDMFERNEASGGSVL
jgi:hypothetical protein